MVILFMPVHLGVLTTSSLFVSAVLAVSLAVAELHLGNALGLSPGATLGTEELVVQTGNCGAVGLVTVVRTVPEPVTVELAGNAHLVCAAELPRVARWEV